MKLKEFLEKNDVTGFEVIENQLVMNAIVNGASFGLNVDTSNIPGGTVLVQYTDFTIDGDTLTVGGLDINIEDTEMLGS